MSTETNPPDLTADLYAVITHLHAHCNEDLLDAVARGELTFTQIKLLHYLGRCRIPPTIKRAAFAIHVTPPSLSRVVDELHRQGLVDRIDDERDKRARRLLLTAAGRDVLAQLAACRLDALDDFTAELNTDERATLTAALEQLLKRDEIAGRRPLRDTAK